MSKYGIEVFQTSDGSYDRMLAWNHLGEKLCRFVGKCVYTRSGDWWYWREMSVLEAMLEIRNQKDEQLLLVLGGPEVLGEIRRVLQQLSDPSRSSEKVEDDLRTMLKWSEHIERILEKRGGASPFGV